MAKYIFVTGGVVSSLGKGITASSLGRLLKNRGLKITIQKFDPYINVDPGTMSPYQHGEVFVTDDGAETDLDLGHYERFIDISIDPANVEGYVYIDKDDIEGYNTSVDEPLKNVKITLHEIFSFTEEGGASSIDRGSVMVDENGHYNFSDLLPGFYMVSAELDDFVINERLTGFLPGNNSYNVSKLKPASVEGRIYYDSNNNNDYDAGEEMEDVKVDIIYKRIAIDGETVEDEILVDTMQTDVNGDYTATVDCGWSGTVRPRLEGFRFFPATMDYTDVQSDLVDQDYTARISFDSPSDYQVIVDSIWAPASGGGDVDDRSTDHRQIRRLFCFGLFYS